MLLHTPSKSSIPHQDQKAKGRNTQLGFIKGNSLDVESAISGKPEMIEKVGKVTCTSNYCQARAKKLAFYHLS